MNVGSLNRRITLFTVADEQDADSGLVTEGARTVFRAGVPCSIQPLSGREYLAAATLQARVTTRILMPWLPGVTTKMQAEDEDGKVYGLEVVLPDQETGRDHLTLMCTEGPP